MVSGTEHAGYRKAKHWCTEEILGIHLWVRKDWLDIEKNDGSEAFSELSGDFFFHEVSSLVSLDTTPYQDSDPLV